MSGQFAALRSSINDVDVAWRSGVAMLRAEIFARIALLVEDVRLIEDQLRSVAEEIASYAPVADVAMPSPPRGFAAFALRLKVAEDLLEQLLRRITALEMILARGVK